MLDSERMQRALRYLDERGLVYDAHRHPPVFTSEEADKYRADFTGVACKNLFLRNKKATRYFLVTIPTTVRFDIDAFTQSVGEKHLSFASPERLLAYLGVTPGSVSPMCLINDPDHRVEFFVHPDVYDARQVSMHPNDNTMSLWVSRDTFHAFLASTKHVVHLLKVDEQGGA
jgi:Ala-tRNA(Pro) deacylase